MCTCHVSESFSAPVLIVRSHAINAHRPRSNDVMGGRGKNFLKLFRKKSGKENERGQGNLPLSSFHQHREVGLKIHIDVIKCFASH